MAEKNPRSGSQKRKEKARERIEYWERVKKEKEKAQKNAKEKEEKRAKEGEKEDSEKQ